MLPSFSFRCLIVATNLVFLPMMELLFMGRNLIRLDSCESTNNFAASLLEQNAPEGTLIVANEQTGGRGQRGKSWYSEPGKNLTLTYILRPLSLRIADQFLLNKTIAIAVARTVELISPGSFIRIKWPNDIFLENRKLAGILVETAVKGSQIVSCMAGIGLNVNQTQFPADSGNPVSLAMELETTLVLDDVMQLLSKQMEVYYFRFSSSQKARLEEEYDSLLWKRGEVYPFKLNGDDFLAEIVQVDVQGKLVLKTPDGEERRFSHGEIQWF
jgi:BirA family biotin operon repressor/biotin-[acetyl-CoA-carboxylase] ligase